MRRSPQVTWAGGRGWLNRKPWDSVGKSKKNDEVYQGPKRTDMAYAQMVVS